MRVLIVDDEPLAREELKYLLTQNQNVTAILEADSIASAQKWLEKETINLIFLDIQLGDENGFTLADQIKKISQRPRIIFATAYDEYALDAFNANALDYILKPFEQSRVDEAIQKGMGVNAATEIDAQKSRDNPRISVTNEDKTRVINKKDIVAAYVENGDLVIVTKQAEFRTKQTLVHLQELLNPQQFLQVHRSFLVNLNEVRAAEPSFNHTYELTMTNGKKIPVSRSFVSEMKRALGM
ncbi:LytR/AlgR family response regulator transcription factor [Paucilactobacillus kaifaensis]|uniref:LytR/AlgR family response regulator transcription factor n=1 Tax=Paucilactobacillus kaifaensis TaxID=2559921 RepID=UPI0010F71C2C|nr:LytTR family transcriptional regulator DNA-binding domain-containing protein [Paucilactobacillus kaifaensis]